MKSYKSTFILLLFVLFGCWNSPPPSFPEGEVVGYKPVYLQDIDSDIELTGSQPVENPGQIYLLGDLLLLNDVGLGIHIIDNTDPSNPVNRGFLKVTGSENMALKDGIVYVNQFSSLLAIDVSDPENVQVISRDNSVLFASEANSLVPPQGGYYFECPDTNKGSIVGWQLTTIENPKCFKQ